MKKKGFLKIDDDLGEPRYRSKYFTLIPKSSAYNQYQNK